MASRSGSGFEDYREFDACWLDLIFKLVTKLVRLHWFKIDEILTVAKNLKKNCSFLNFKIVSHPFFSNFYGRQKSKS